MSYPEYILGSIFDQEVLGTPAIDDDCSQDNTGDWDDVDCTLSFDTDHYAATVDAPNTVYFRQFDILTPGVLYKASFDYYIPSENVNTDGFFFAHGGNLESRKDLYTVKDAWTSDYQYFIAGPAGIPPDAGDEIYFYLTNGGSTSGLTVGDWVAFRNILVSPVTAPDKSIPVKDTWPALVGDELHVGPNAASDPNGNEADAITGWTAIGTPPRFESVTEGTETGSYCIQCIVNTNGQGFSQAFTTVAGKLYRLKFDSKQGGGDPHRVEIGTTNGGVEIYEQTGIANASFTEHVIYFFALTTTTYISFTEAGGNDNADWYIDNLSLRVIQLSWTAYGRNKVELDEVGDALKVTYEDDPSGARLFLADSYDLSENLVDGETYLCVFEGKLEGGLETVSVSAFNGVATEDTVFLTTSWATYSLTFIFDNTSTAYIRFGAMATGEIGYIRNIRLGSYHTYGNQLNDAKYAALLAQTTLDPKPYTTGNIFDKESLSSEQMANYDFTRWTDDNPDGWLVIGESGSDPMVTQVSGGARLYTSGAVVAVQQATMQLGKLYKVIVDIDTVTVGGVRLQNDSIIIDNNISTVGVRTYYIIGSASNKILKLIRKDVALPNDVTVRSFSLKEVLSPNKSLIPPELWPQLAGPELVPATSQDLQDAVWFTTNITVVDSDSVDLLATTGLMYHDDIDVEEKQLYRYSLTVTFGTATGVRCAVYDASGLSFIKVDQVLNDGTETVVYFDTPAGCTKLRIYPVRNAAGTGTADITGISVRKINTSWYPYGTNKIEIDETEDAMLVTQGNDVWGAYLTLADNTDLGEDLVVDNDYAVVFTAKASRAGVHMVFDPKFGSNVDSLEISTTAFTQYSIGFTASSVDQDVLRFRGLVSADDKVWFHSVAIGPLYLAGFHIDDLEYQWLKDQGAVGGQINDLWYDFLMKNIGIPVGPELMPEGSGTDLTDAAWTANNVTVDDATTITLIAANGSIYLSPGYVTVVPGKLYKYSVLATHGTVTDPTTAIYDLSNAGFIVQDIALNDGSVTEIYFTAPDGCTQIRAYGMRAASSTGTMTTTNISVMEVLEVLGSTSKDLFDQEVLGSELVTNGGFDTDTDWTKDPSWTISSGTANSNGTGILQQNIGQAVGKVYKIVYTVVNYSSGTVKLLAGAGAFPGANPTRNANGTYTEYKIALSTDNFAFYGSSFVGSLDDVSVKEVLQPYKGIPRIDPWPALAGSEAVSTDFTSGWSTVGTGPSIIDADSFSTTGAGGIYIDGLSPGTLYRMDFAKTHTGSGIKIYITDTSYSGTLVVTELEASKTFYYIPKATEVRVYLRNEDAGTTDFTAFSIRPVQISWERYGTNTMQINDTEAALQITCVDNAGGAVLYFKDASDLYTDLIIGKRYTLIFEARESVGQVEWRVWEGAEFSANKPLTTNFETYSHTFTAQAATGCALAFTSMSAGEIVYIRELHIIRLDDPRFFGNHLNDLAFRWLRGLGYTGQINDMWLDYWVAEGESASATTMWVEAVRDFLISEGWTASISGNSLVVLFGSITHIISFANLLARNQGSMPGPIWSDIEDALDAQGL